MRCLSLCVTFRKILSSPSTAFLHGTPTGELRPSHLAACEQRVFRTVKHNAQGANSLGLDVAGMAAFTGYCYTSF